MLTFLLDYDRWSGYYMIIFLCVPFIALLVAEKKKWRRKNLLKSDSLSCNRVYIFSTSKLQDFNFNILFVASSLLPDIIKFDFILVGVNPESCLNYRNYFFLLWLKPYNLFHWCVRHCYVLLLTNLRLSSIFLKVVWTLGFKMLIFLSGKLIYLDLARYAQI